jgi:hypothetical protein
MSMPKSAAAIVLALVVAACGAVPGGHGNLPAPSPPTAALANWSDFPVNTKPRPIIWFGDVIEEVGPGMFPDDKSKLTWVCDKFVLGPGLALSSISAATATAKWTSGASASYPSIGSGQAWSALMARPRGGNTADCASLKPFVITAVRWGTAEFATDRGGATMSAWLFDVPEAKGYLGYPALDPSAYWTGRAITSDGQGLGARVSADGRTLTIGAIGARDQSGPCGSDYTTSAAESTTAVAVAIKTYPHDAQAVCDLVARMYSIDVHLKAPLGDRVLLDENGNVGTAS